MAIASNIVYNSVLGTATLINQIAGTNTIESLTYTNSTNQFTGNTFTSVASVNKDDILITLLSYQIFSTGILNAFKIPQTASTPQLTTVFSNDGISNMVWQQQFTPADVDFILKYTCTYPNGTINVARRNSVVTLNWNQWLYILDELALFTRLFRIAYKI